MNMVNKDYVQLEEQIQKLSEKWSKSLANETLTNPESINAIHHYPIIPQLSLTINIDLYHSFILELCSLLKEKDPSLAEEIAKIERTLSHDVLQEWFQEAVMINAYFFDKFASEHNIVQWLPVFISEHAVRPFLRKMAEEIAEQLHDVNGDGQCPACGEPPRLAVINEKGKKEMICPRCHHSWQEKKISCAYCHTEESGKLEILKVEGEELGEIYVCQQCKGYTKTIDKRKMIKEESPELLDIKTIHLDYVAQENGFGIPEGKETH